MEKRSEKRRDGRGPWWRDFRALIAVGVFAYGFVLPLTSGNQSAELAELIGQSAGWIALFIVVGSLAGAIAAWLMVHAVVSQPRFIRDLVGLFFWAMIPSSFGSFACVLSGLAGLVPSRHPLVVSAMATLYLGTGLSGTAATNYLRKQRKQAGARRRT